MFYPLSSAQGPHGTIRRIAADLRQLRTLAGKAPERGRMEAVQRLVAEAAQEIRAFAADGYTKFDPAMNMELSPVRAVSAEAFDFVERLAKSVQAEVRMVPQTPLPDAIERVAAATLRGREHTMGLEVAMRPVGEPMASTPVAPDALEVSEYRTVAHALHLVHNSSIDRAMLAVGVRAVDAGAQSPSDLLAGVAAGLHLADELSPDVLRINGIFPTPRRDARPALIEPSPYNSTVRLLGRAATAVASPLLGARALLKTAVAAKRDAEHADRGRPFTDAYAAVTEGLVDVRHSAANSFRADGDTFSDVAVGGLRSFIGYRCAWQGLPDEDLTSRVEVAVDLIAHYRDHFAGQHAQRAGRPGPSLTDQALAQMDTQEALERLGVQVAREVGAITRLAAFRSSPQSITPDAPTELLHGVIIDEQIIAGTPPSWIWQWIENANDLTPANRTFLRDLTLGLGRDLALDLPSPVLGSADPHGADKARARAVVQVAAAFGENARTTELSPTDFVADSQQQIATMRAAGTLEDDVEAHLALHAAQFAVRQRLLHDEVAVIEAQYLSDPAQSLDMAQMPLDVALGAPVLPGSVPAVNQPNYAKAVGRYGQPFAEVAADVAAALAEQRARRLTGAHPSTAAASPAPARSVR